MNQASNYTEEIHGKLDWKTGFIQQAGSRLVLSLAGWSKAGGQWDQWSSDSTKKTARNLVCGRNCRDTTCVTMFFCFFIYEIGWEIHEIGWKIQEIGWDNCETRQLKDATGWNFRVLVRFIQEMGWLIWRIGCFIWAVSRFLYEIWRHLCAMCWFNRENCEFNQEMTFKIPDIFRRFWFYKKEASGNVTTSRAVEYW